MISRTLPLASQNSASPNHETAKIFRTAYVKIMTTMTAATGILSVQNVKTRADAVISKGTNTTLTLVTDGNERTAEYLLAS
jgi:hypothetical protein